MALLPPPSTSNRDSSMPLMLHSSFSDLALPRLAILKRRLSGLGRTGIGVLRDADVAGGCVTFLCASCLRDRNEDRDCGLFTLPSLLLLHALLPLTTRCALEDVFDPQEGLRPFFLRLAMTSSASPAL